ncbi:MAG: signal transduction histidine kinase [Candidatus Paceibacteria bacterium]|jgi:signal transduction histidine kinase
MSLPLKTTRTLQLAIVAMLATSLATIFYWVIDEARYMNNAEQDWLAQLELEAHVSQSLLEDGYQAQRIEEFFPALLARDGTVMVDPAAAAALSASRRKRLFRIGSEGTFLLLVLAGGIATLTYTLRQPAELSRRQANFVAAVSHEFKTPLASIKLACETLLLRDMDLSAQRILAKRMLSDTGRLETMVTNILDAGRVDEGRLSLSPQELPLEAVIGPLLKRAHERGLGSDVLLRAELEPDVQVMADPVALSAVLDNLISNALQSVSTAGGGEVLIAANSTGQEVQIDVRDDGLGFPPSESKKLFEKFYRLGDEMRRETKGSGLGLYIVKTFIEKSGGRVQAKSKGLGHGATISLWIQRGKGDMRA